VLARDPAMISWTSGISARTRRHASITPSGSFQGSNRETWVTIGRFGSIVYASSTSSIVPSLTGRVFTDSGSIDGGISAISGPTTPGCTKSAIVDAPSYRLTMGRRIPTGGWGTERRCGSARATGRAADLLLEHATPRRLRVVTR
jgi:hypothetical protein